MTTAELNHLGVKPGSDYELGMDSEALVIRALQHYASHLKQVADEFRAINDRRNPAAKNQSPVNAVTETTTRRTLIGNVLVEADQASDLARLVQLGVKTVVHSVGE